MLSLIVAAWFVLPFAAPQEADAVGDHVKGRHLATARCNACHAIGRRGASPMADAPAFRTLPEKYNVEGLAEALAEGISTGDPRIPEHVLEAAEIADLIAYLKTFERPSR